MAAGGRRGSRGGAELEKKDSFVGGLVRRASEKLGLGQKDPHPARRRASSLTGQLGAPDGEEAVEEEMGDLGGAKRDLSLCIMRGHESSVYGCVFAPGMETFVSGGRDRTLRLWQLGSVDEQRSCASATLTHTITGHSGFVLCCDYAPSGKHFVSGSEDSKVYLWDRAEARRVAVGAAHTSKVYATAFSPGDSLSGGAHLVTGSLDRTVRIWDAQTMQESCMLPGHTDNVFAARFSHDGALIASGGDDKRILVWDWRARREAYALHGHRATIWSATFSQDDGQVLSCGMGSELFVFCTRQRVVQCSAQAVHGNTPTHQALYASGGAEIVTCGRDRMIQVRENSPGLPLSYSLQGHTGTVYHIDLHADGDTLLSSSVDATLRLWSLKRSRP